MTDEERQAVIDEEHLRLLAFFHYISGGITVAFSLFFGVWIVFMAAMFAFMPVPPVNPGHPTPPPLHGPPAMMFWIFGTLLVLGLGYGVLEIVSGRWISRKTKRVGSLIVAIPRLLFLPYGLILSILTLMVLERPSVKQLYRR